MTTPVEYNVHVRRSTTVKVPAHTLYREWRSPQRLADFVFGAEPITIMDERRTRWAVRIPGLGWKTWASEIVEDVPAEIVAWRTVGETDLPHEWIVRFATAPDGIATVVTLEIRSHVTGGQVTDALARLTGRSLDDHAAATLRNFKALMETGRVHGAAAGRVRVRRLTPARRRALFAIAGAAVVSYALVRRQQSRRRRGFLGFRRR
jgi:uncharacterized membrane protein